MSDALRTHLEVLRLKAKHDQGTPEEWIADIQRAFEDEGWLSGQEWIVRLEKELSQVRYGKLYGGDSTDITSGINIAKEAAKRVAGLR